MSFALTYAKILHEFRFVCSATSALYVCFTSQSLSSVWTLAQAHEAFCSVPKYWGTLFVCHHTAKNKAFIPLRQDISLTPSRERISWRATECCWAVTDLFLFHWREGDRGSTVVRVLCYKSEGRWSIPAGVSGFFVDMKSFRSHYGPGADLASNRNEYEEYFVRVKATGA